MDKSTFKTVLLQMNNIDFILLKKIGQIPYDFIQWVVQGAHRCDEHRVL